MIIDIMILIFIMIIININNNHNDYDNHNINNNTNAEWLNKVSRKLEHIEKQESLSITVADVKKMITKMPNWKSPGPDGVQGYWIKHLTKLHMLIADPLQKCLDNGDVPE